MKQAWIMAVKFSEGVLKYLSGDWGTKLAIKKSVYWICISEC